MKISDRIVNELNEYRMSSVGSIPTAILLGEHAWWELRKEFKEVGNANLPKYEKDWTFTGIALRRVINIDLWAIEVH